MKITNVLRELRNISITKTIWYNFVCSHVERVEKGLILVYKKTTIYFEEGAKLIIKRGRFQLGRCLGNRSGTTFRMQKNSIVEINGASIIEYGADILVKQDAQLVLGDNSYINCWTMIRCHKKITIGDDGFISSNVDIRDSDGHSLDGICKTESVYIGDHVWICNGVKVLKGVTINNGSMIGAGAIVTHDIPSNSLAYGIPARVMREKITWE